MVCTRKTKTLVSTCVILSGMTNIICLLYVGWVTNYIASMYVRGQEPAPDKKLEDDKGDTLKIIERLDHLENVIKQHIQGMGASGNLDCRCGPGVPRPARGAPGLVRISGAIAGLCGRRRLRAVCTLLPERGTLLSAAVRASPGHTCVRGTTRVDVCSSLAVWGRAAHVPK